jgi:hypothetical protein
MAEKKELWYSFKRVPQLFLFFSFPLSFQGYSDGEKAGGWRGILSSSG